MATTEKSAVIYTPEFRVSFPALAQPRPSENGPPKYSVNMLFKHPSKMSAAEKATYDKFLAVVTQGVNDILAKKGINELPEGFRMPLRDQGPKAAKYDGYEKGAKYGAANTQIKPGVVNRRAIPIVNVAEEVYAGCYAVATVDLYYYNKKGNQGIAFGLFNVQKTRDGEPLGNMGRSATEDFQPLPEEEGDEDADTDYTAGADDLFK